MIGLGPQLPAEIFDLRSSSTCGPYLFHFSSWPLEGSPLYMTSDNSMSARQRRTGNSIGTGQLDPGLISNPDHMQQICAFLDVSSLLRLGRSSKAHARRIR